MLFDIDLLSSCSGRSSIFEGPEREDLLHLEVTAETGLWYGLQNRLASLYDHMDMMDIKVSKDKHIADGLIERTSSMLDEIESKIVHIDKQGDQ